MWVKICGLTSVENSLAVAEAGVDAIGLNFYAKSKRVVSVEVAREIVTVLPASVLPVGLFVNHSREEIEAVLSLTGIKTIQLHGDEPPEFAAHFKQFQVIKAFRVNEENIAQLEQEIDSYRSVGINLFACLIDAKVGETYGGTGQTAPWDKLLASYSREKFPPLLLAGGLTPTNVAAAISTVQPWGVDTASGVEISPGLKDIALAKSFTETAKSVLR